MNVIKLINQLKDKGIVGENHFIKINKQNIIIFILLVFMSLDLNYENRVIKS